MVCLLVWSCCCCGGGIGLLTRRSERPQLCHRRARIRGCEHRRARHKHIGARGSHLPRGRRVNPPARGGCASAAPPACAARGCCGCQAHAATHPSAAMSMCGKAARSARIFSSITGCALRGVAGSAPPGGVRQSADGPRSGGPWALWWARNAAVVGAAARLQRLAPKARVHAQYVHARRAGAQQRRRRLPGLIRRQRHGGAHARGADAGHQRCPLAVAGCRLWVEGHLVRPRRRQRIHVVARICGTHVAVKEEPRALSRARAKRWT